jgi:L-lactate dehydrogenase complex protein LldF
MKNEQDIFLNDSENKVFDAEHHRKLFYNIDQYDKKVLDGKKQYVNIELAKIRAAAIKHKVIENLERYLCDFESAFKKRGGHVIWAQDAEEAISEVNKIVKKANVKMVVKAKSMTTEEIHLNKALEKQGIESLETDLGEYIVQLRNEPPYHIVTPAMHLSKEDVARTFHEKQNTPIDWNPKEIVAHVRRLLREKYLQAEVGVTGANFLIADTGCIAVTENEGNALNSVSHPRVHIAIVGIEKVIPTMNDLDLFWSLLATHGTGQNLTVYNTILSGPRQPNETDGPDEMYVILLDNGRTELLAQKEQRRALSCIRCGACLNGCPIYKNIGGHSYGTTYSGPIGSVISPYLNGVDKFKHLSYASSLCGKCTEVCPVKIDLHNLLLLNRRDFVDKGHKTKSEDIVWYAWKAAMMKRKTMERGGAKAKNFLLRRFFKKSWGERRDLPTIAAQSFNEIWKERAGRK